MRLCGSVNTVGTCPVRCIVFVDLSALQCQLTIYKNFSLPAPLPAVWDQAILHDDSEEQILLTGSADRHRANGEVQAGTAMS